MTKVLIFAAVAEAATGLALLIIPSLVGQLLLGEELSGIAIPVARVAGIAVIALGIACWPGTPLLGMLAYSVLVTVYLAYLGFAGGAPNNERERADGFYLFSLLELVGSTKPTRVGGRDLLITCGRAVDGNSRVLAPDSHRA